MFLSLLPVFLLSTLSFHWFLRLLYYVLRKLAFCVLGFCYCVTNYHELLAQNHTHFIIWQFLWLRSLVRVISFLCFSVSPVCSADTGWVCGLIIGWTKNALPSSLGQSLFPCGCRTEAPVSCLRLPSAPTGHPHLLGTWASPAWPLMSWQLTFSRPVKRSLSNASASKTEAFKYQNGITPLPYPIGEKKVTGPAHT